MSKKKEKVVAEPQKEAAETENVAVEQQNAETEKQQEEETKSEESEQNEEDLCDKLTRQLADCQDKYARLSAEFDNYRKRTLKEKMDLVTGGSEKAVLAVLPVVDDLERAVANIKDETLKEGVNLILKKMMDSLKSLSVEKIDALGLELDVELHNAIAKFPVEEEEKKGKIIDVVKNGYRIGEKVIRHAEVVVGE